MFDVSLSTLISVVLVLLFIIFVLMISKAKPNQNQVKEMKETGWEIVGEIQHYLEKIEVSKQEIDEKLAEIKAIEQTIKQTTRLAPTSEPPTKEKRKNEPVFISSKVSQQKVQIVDLYRKGHGCEDIAEQLDIQKGVVEVILNMEKVKKNA